MLQDDFDKGLKGSFLKMPRKLPSGHLGRSLLLNDAQGGTRLAGGPGPRLLLITELFIRQCLKEGLCHGGVGMLAGASAVNMPMS